jgi:hypothetical protein
VQSPAVLAFALNFSGFSGAGVVVEKPEKFLGVRQPCCRFRGSTMPNFRVMLYMSRLASNLENDSVSFAIRFVSYPLRQNLPGQY